jgi:tetratricopeptide (TPR) repeat protein
MKKICFVIMGFGKKTDFSSGRTLDLDMTYKNIIKPAVISADYECIRADEIQDSGIIDKSMYALLIHADLVIADISTYNPNAIYELGIRHASKPYSTIIMKEKEGKIPFDLDHNRIFQYSHMEEDIGATEAKRCQQELSSLIVEITKNKLTDSPFYEYIRGISPPILPDEEYSAIITDLADREKHIFAFVERAKELMSKSEFIEAARYWEKASNKAESETFFIQQKALCVYKSKHPSERTALIDALSIINELEPDGNTNDPETLGITGAIYKRLWLIDNDIEQLKRAIKYYGKCFKIRNDYYTGENYSLCLEFMSQNEKNPEEKIYYKIEAKKTREKIVELITETITNESFEMRNDRKWIYATLSHCYLALDLNQKAEEFETFFKQENPADWELQTFLDSKNQLLTLKNE